MFKIILATALAIFMMGCSSNQTETEAPEGVHLATYFIPIQSIDTDGVFIQESFEASTHIEVDGNETILVYDVKNTQKAELTDTSIDQTGKIYLVNKLLIIGKLYTETTDEYVANTTAYPDEAVLEVINSTTQDMKVYYFLKGKGLYKTIHNGIVKHDLH